jgi:hypothetical protein
MVECAHAAALLNHAGGGWCDWTDSEEQGEREAAAGQVRSRLVSALCLLLDVRRALQMLSSGRFSCYAIVLAS